MEELHKELQHIVAASEHVALHPPTLQVFGRVEQLLAAQQYRWNGLRRGGDPAHPHLFFQYTLAGWGHFTANNITHRVVPGIAFTAIVPSEHVYELPPSSPGWTFFWIRIAHPYVVERIAERQQRAGPVVTAEPSSALVRTAVALLAGSYRPTSGDSITQERAVFEFLWEHERAARRGDQAQSTGERWLDEVRAYVRAALPRPVAVPELAGYFGMSRSHFSHVFKHATGMGPGQFVLQIRLDAATEKLLHTMQPVAMIAQATGFANANHFCKAFRERFHVSPGAFRRQMT